MIVTSHFDYAKQAILYVPPDMPDPRSTQFGRSAAEKIRRLLEITQGRAFCLFTSYAQMNDIHDRLLGELPFPMLLQGRRRRTRCWKSFGLRPMPCCLLLRHSGRALTFRVNS